MTTAPETTTAPWSGAGVVAGLFGVAVSWCVAAMLGVADNPVAAVAEQVVRMLPGGTAEFGIQLFGTADKPALVVIILLALAGLSAWFGRLRRRGWQVPLAGFALLAAVGGGAVVAQGEGLRALVPVAAGLVGWIGALEVLTGPLRNTPTNRRGFLLAAGVLVLGGVALTVSGKVLSGRRHIEEARLLLKLDGVTVPEVPAGTEITTAEVGRPWVTPNEDFYLIDTTFSPPAIDPQRWRLRVHGLVDRPLELTLADLMGRERTEAWVTLACVSNPVGGDLIGNAWWSGVRIAPLLAEAGVHADADAVLQTSEDGWTCLTPLEVLTDDRQAMLAVAMNGEPLPIEHGFPVRVVVPGLYGYVSACKWVVDLEVTRFEDAEGYWTSRGWSALGPIKLASRIDVPADGATVAAGEVRIAGSAWQQHTGVAAVEVQVDADGWREAVLAHEASVDSWVQWALTVDLEPGDHRVAVRATNHAGDVQTAVERDVAPDGATGWHTITVQAT